MNDIVIIIVIVNTLYFITWIVFNKLRNSNNMTIKEWDNGYEFYKSLSNNDRSIYWKQDTHILNIVFSVLLFFIECTLFLIYKENNFWIICLIIGIFLSCAIGIIMSLKLRKKFK